MHKENECTKPAMLPDELRLGVKFFLTEIKMSGFNTSPILSSGRRRDEQLSKRENSPFTSQICLEYSMKHLTAHKKMSQTRSIYDANKKYILH